MPSAIPKIDFDQFRVKNPDFRGSFERLCYHLFCREFRAASGIKADFNEAGLETKPIPYKGKRYGFQAKFFDQNMGPRQYAQVEDSVEKALKHFKGKLDVIYVYSNKPITSGARAVKNIEKRAAAAGVTIEWRVPTHFDALLIKPENLDLGQLFFGLGDEFGFFKSHCDIETTTLILSSTHLGIPLKDNGKKDPAKILLSGNDKVTLVLGQPGTGKSILMHDLLLSVGHVRSANLKIMRASIVKASALPMLVNFKDCVADTVENVIRNRQLDYGVRRSQCGFVYLFDGLDELNAEKVEVVLHYLAVLANEQTTKRIVVSCRSANPSRYSFMSYFPKARQLELGPLTASHRTAYFKNRDEGLKQKNFKVLEAQSPKFLAEIKDIFLLSLLWETIERLGPNPLVIDLFRQQVDRLLEEPRFKKNIAELNLLDPKKDAIIALNEDISLAFQKRFQFRFTREELQGLILEKYPRLTYKDANAIISYLSSNFFEGEGPTTSAHDSFIYQHRRYQEYFVARKLKREYRANRSIIREDFLSNGEFLEEVFLPFLRREYERDGDLAGALEMNLIDVYLGNHSGYGADSPGYSMSDGFIPAILAQKPVVYGRIMSDENLQLGKKVASSPKNVALFWGAGKKEFAKGLLANLDHQIDEALKQRDDGKPEALDKINQMVSREIEDWFYIRLVVKNESIPSVLAYLRKHYADLSPQPEYSGDVSARDKGIRPFMRVCIAHRLEDLEKVLDSFEDPENQALLEELIQLAFLPLLLRSDVLMTHAKKVLGKLREATGDNIHAVAFIRSVLGLGLTEAEKTRAKEELTKLRQARPIDLHMRTGVYHHALLAFALGENRFDALLKRDSRAPDGHGYFSELELYAALFAAFVAMLRVQMPIQQIARSYRTYLATHDRAGRAEFHWQMSQLWVRVFVESKAAPDDLLAMKRLVLGEDCGFAPISFIRSLRVFAPALFDRIVNEHEVEAIAKESAGKTRENRDVVDEAFDMALLLSSFNPERAVFFISKGINEGILRHGWRKDVIVSGLLIEALEILWKNNWATRDQLENYSRRVFDLAMRVAAITDGKGTWRGPNRLLRMVSQFDLKLAEEFAKKIGHESYGNYMRNDALRDILKAKIRLGVSFDEIEKEMEGFGKDYDYEGKPSPDYFEEKLRVYMAVCGDEVATPDEKQRAFSRAHDLLEEMRREKVIYFRDLLNEERDEYAQLCKKYGKPVNMPDKSTDSFERPKIVMSEAKFVAKVASARDKKGLAALFKQLSTYETRIVVEKKESWDAIVRRTHEIAGDLGPLTDYLKEMRYPHSDYFSENSHYLHYAVAAALRESDTKGAMRRYLYEHSGYEGFVNTMRALEVDGDKDGCVRLFTEFIGFCDFLVN